MAAIGKKIPHDSALGHVTGEALYIDDIPFGKNELVVDFVGSPCAHGKIKSIDFEKAKQIEGIVGIYTHQDIPGHNLFGPIIVDEYFLAEELCEYLGQPIVIIAAKNWKAVKQAKQLVNIQIEAYEPVFSIEQACKKNQYLGETRQIKRGNVQNAFKKSECVLEDTFYSNGQDHFYLESQAAIAYPGETNELTIISSTQNPTETQQVVAELLDIGQHEVVSICKRMGGAFGGKETQAAIPAMMAALAAYHTKCPARVVYTKDDDMKITGKRHPYQTHYKAAFTREGQITGLRVDFYSNGGAFADLSTAIMERSMLHAENAYYIPHIEINGTVCKTNFPPNTAFRGFGGPQSMAVIENIIEEISIYLKKDAYDIRTLNCYGVKKNNVTPYGQIVKNTILPEIFEELSQTADYKQRYAAVKHFNQQKSTKLKGIAMTPIKFGISFTTKFLNQGNALVNIYKDGTVQVSTGGTEMGQGLNTKIRQIVADEFGIDHNHVKLMPTSTEKNNNTSPTAASAGTDLNGLAAMDACQKIRAGLIGLASRHFASVNEGLAPAPECIRLEGGYVFDERLPHKKLKFSELIMAAYQERISLGARGFYTTPGVDFNRETGKGNPFFYYTTGCCVAEVLIERLTGNLTIERIDLLMDIGESINPGIDRGQIEGGLIQGIGWLTNEELRYQDNGALLSYSPTTYKIPNIQDLPKIFHVNTIKNPHHTINVRRSKAVGEPPFMLSLSVWAAVKNALSYVADNQIPKLRIPATSEEILRRITQYTSKAQTDLESAESEISLLSSLTNTEKTRVLPV
ncbi:MAG: xanthine dehydrogenase molybdopterin binding subunit [SAR324 cluster bacterium]|nr:xanthine dehydrogenase molybdopterin binding subunit [SAR324 cluster bacterium]